jgi:hypothetical protein
MWQDGLRSQLARRDGLAGSCLPQIYRIRDFRLHSLHQRHATPPLPQARVQAAGSKAHTLAKAPEHRCWFKLTPHLNEFEQHAVAPDYH